MAGKREGGEGGEGREWHCNRCCSKYGKLRAIIITELAHR